MQKILAYFNNLSDQARYAAFVFVIFLVILVDVLCLLLPQMSDIANVNDKIKKISEDTQQVRIDRQRTRLLEKNLEKQRDQYKDLTAKLHSSQEVPGILSSISSIAKEYGVKIDQLTPEYGQAEVLKKTSDGQYYALPILIKARCGYHMFGHFLNKLEDENMYLLLKDFIIQNQDNSPATHSFSMTVEVILLDQGMALSKNI